MEPRGEDVSAKQDKRDREYERKLVDRAKAGERVAVRELIDLHKDRLFGFIWRMVRDHHEAEDVCQDAFLKAFASLDTFSSEYRFSTWLFTIAYRVCLNRLRRKRALTGTDLSMTSQSLETDETASSSLESREASELRQTIWTAVDRLTAPQRAAVLLFYRHEMSCQEIARIVQLPLATVKSHLHRARARLREMLETVNEQDLHAFRNLHERAG